MNIKHISLSLLLALSVTSCADKGWGVSGTVSNAPEGAKVSVEGFNAGNWYNIDSVEVSKDGKFAYTSPVGSPYPDVYRVSIDGKYIYFPIDSLETITVSTDASDFDRNYNLEGSQIAIEMMNIDKRIAAAVDERGAQAVVNDSVLKRELGQIINDDQSGVLGYYVINKTVGGQPLFTTDNAMDLRILGSLANKFNTMFPDDPRTEYLIKKFVTARANLNPGAVRQIEATASGYIDIDLYDTNGVKRKLSDVVNNAGLTILSFTSYQIEPSLAYNVELNRLYDKYRGNNIAIYQVSVDSDEVEWRTNASNLPWTAVWYDGKDGGSLLSMYNVQILPSTYIIDGTGTLVERVDDPTKLEDAVKKHL